MENMQAIDKMFQVLILLNDSPALNPRGRNGSEVTMFGSAVPVNAHIKLLLFG